MSTLQLLPRVTPEVSTAIAQVIQDQGNVVMVTIWLNQISEENPVLAAEIKTWARMQSDPVNAVAGASMIYQLLRAQAAADKLATLIG